MPKLKSQIHDIARNCDPPINIGIGAIDDLVYIEIHSSEDKPHKCSTGFYIRKHATSQKMGRNELVDFIYDQGRKKFDSLPCNKYVKKDLDHSALDEYLNKAGINTNITPGEILFNLGVIEKKQLNNAGVLFFTSSPKKIFYQCIYYMCQVFRYK